MKTINSTHRRPWTNQLATMLMMKIEPKNPNKKTKVMPVLSHLKTLRQERIMRPEPPDRQLALPPPPPLSPLTKVHMTECMQNKKR